MAQVGNDCYFFYYSSCKKGPACSFRHSAPALGKEDVCQDWAKGSCIVPNCARRHMGIHKDRGSMPCSWESQLMGCIKPFCPFKLLKLRPAAPLQTGQLQPTTTAPQGNPVKAGPAQVLPPDFKLLITIPGDSNAQRSPTIRTIGNSQERLRHAPTQGIATDSTAADSRMDMRRATRAMSRYHWVHARDHPNQQHRSGPASHGPIRLLPTKRAASVQQKDQTKPLGKRRRPEVEVKEDTFKVQSLNKIGHTNCFTKKPLSMPSSFAQRQTSSSAQRQTSSSAQSQTLPSCPLQSSGLSVKELRAKRFSKQQQLQQQLQQDTEQEQRRKPWAKVHASTKRLPVKATQKPGDVPATPPASTAAGLHIKSLDEIRAEKRKHHETTSDSTISAAGTCQRRPADSQSSTIQRRPADSTSKESTSVVVSSASKSVCSSVLSTAPTKSSTQAVTPAKITRLSSHSSAKKESPATTKVSQSEGSEVPSTADTTTMKSDAKSEFDWLDDINLLDDDAFEKAMKEFVGDVTYVDLNKPDLDETVNSEDLLLEAELMI
ncbi:zinc finger CCCH domain-containing protein 11A-like [Sycon ciliatum]|uniref:zinc finger CCCH domain-containing protein 11A-like n=2 Tax=Sycon ciliatum TaxID=27933 RepID=UPI0031F6A91C